MKKIILSLALVASGFVAMSTPPVKKEHKKQEVLNVDTAASSVNWHAKKVTGEHFGSIHIASGQLTLDGNKLAGGKFDIDMNSIDVKDLQGEWRDKLTGHLKSDDFFSVAKFGTSQLVVKSVTPIAGAKPGEDNFTVVADVTIKGITNEVSFPALVVVKKGEVIANAEFFIDRSKFDIRYGSKTFFPNIGDKMINDEFHIKVRVIAKKSKV